MSSSKPVEDYVCIIPFTRFFEQAEISALGREELRDYRESQKDFWDLNSVIETAERKAKAEGEAIGTRKRDEQMARTMRLQGYSEEQISALLNSMD